MIMKAFVRKGFLPSLEIFVSHKAFRKDFILDFYVYTIWRGRKIPKQGCWNTVIPSDIYLTNIYHVSLWRSTDDSGKEIPSKIGHIDKNEHKTR